MYFRHRDEDTERKNMGELLHRDQDEVSGGELKPPFLMRASAPQVTGDVAYEAVESADLFRWVNFPDILRWCKSKGR